MKKRDLFSIGDVAKLFHVGVGTLRYYETAGLLAPEYTDPDTNYRYYSVRQFEVLNTIRYLRALDMPLPQIADFLRNKDVGTIEEKLRQQKQAVSEKLRELRQIESRIDHRLQQLRDAKTAEFDVIRRETLPACRLSWVREDLTITRRHDIEMPIIRLAGSDAAKRVFLGQVGVGIDAEHLRAGRFDRYDCVFLVLDDGDTAESALSLPETPGVVVRFCGSHGEAAAQYKRLMAYLNENGLEPAGFSREITMIDYGITNDPSQFVTEISVPVRK